MKSAKQTWLNADALTSNAFPDDLPINADGSFVFPSALADGSAYLISVKTQPTSPTQTCSVTSGRGSLAGANISNVNISCVLDTTEAIPTLQEWSIIMLSFLLFMVSRLYRRKHIK